MWLNPTWRIMVPYIRAAYLLYKCSQPVYVPALNKAIISASVFSVKFTLIFFSCVDSVLVDYELIQNFLADFKFIVKDTHSISWTLEKGKYYAMMIYSFKAGKTM